MKKIVILVISLFLFNNIALAQDVSLDNLPGNAASQLPQRPNVPALPNTAGLPNNATGPTSAPAGLPGNAQGATTAPSVYGQPNNGSAQAPSGAFLQLSVPDGHGLPGGDAQSMLRRIIDNGLSLIALVGILAILVAALQLWLAQGKADGIGKAKLNIFNIILGFAIVLLAWSGVTIVLKFLGFT